MKKKHTTKSSRQHDRAWEREGERRWEATHEPPPLAKTWKLSSSSSSSPKQEFYYTHTHTHARTIKLSLCLYTSIQSLSKQPIRRKVQSWKGLNSDNNVIWWRRSLDFQANVAFLFFYYKIKIKKKMFVWREMSLLLAASMEWVDWGGTKGLTCPLPFWRKGRRLGVFQSFQAGIVGRIVRFGFVRYVSSLRFSLLKLPRFYIMVADRQFLPAPNSPLFF